METKQEKKTVFGVFKEIFNWYPSTYPVEERKLLFKLDLSILVFACCCFFTKYLDQTNVSNAYVSGMQIDLSLYGNQLNYFNVCYFTAYVASQIPLLLLISRPKLTRWALPTLEIIWGILTFCQSRVTSTNQLYALRFLVGVFEAPVFAGTHFILGSWYRGPELFKRAGTWFICNALGTMVSGYLQAAAYTNLDGVGGLAGWRWLFVIDGIITVPIALIGFVIFPGLPESPKPYQFSEEEIDLAKRRMREIKAASPGKINLDVFKRTLSRWHFWVFVGAYICMIIASYPWSYMNLWLKAEGYSVPQINKLPTVISALQILASWLGTTLAAIYSPNLIYAVASIATILGCLLQSIWFIPTGLKFFAWYLFGFTGCLSPVLYSLVNTVLKDDAEERALVLSSMMTIGYSFNIWVPLLLFQTVDAPRWKSGWPASLVFTAILWALFITGTVLYRRDQRKTAPANDTESVEGSEVESSDITDEKDSKQIGSAEINVKPVEELKE